MHVMIATDGSLDAAKTAALVAPLADNGGRATVFTVVEVPRGLIDALRGSSGDPADSRARVASVEHRSTQAADPPVTSWTGDDAVLANYIESAVKNRTSELVAALQAAGVEHSVVGEEGENAARSVLDAIDAHDVDVVCLGTHGLGRFEGLLGSLSTKVARRASCSVLLVR
jgi:nucleotide-binding universal stress UspA family protein